MSKNPEHNKLIITFLPNDMYSIKFGMTEPLMYEFTNTVWPHVIRVILETDKVLIRIRT